jgi:hypothetical protein
MGLRYHDVKSMGNGWASSSRKQGSRMVDDVLICIETRAVTVGGITKWDASSSENANNPGARPPMHRSSK